MRAASLVRDADAALYRAKGRGRNAISAGNVVAADFKPQVNRAS
jgi:hypothetical protein